MHSIKLCDLAWENAYWHVHVHIVIDLRSCSYSRVM